MLEWKQNHDGWHGSNALVSMGSTTENNALALQRLKCKEVRYLYQVHSATIFTDHTYTNCLQEGDGLISIRDKTMLIVKTADCIPVYLFDGEAIGMVHGGWRGIKAGILQEALRYLNISHTYAVLGPGICQLHYEVDRDLYEDWLVQEPLLKTALISVPGDNHKRYFDLKGTIAGLLHQAGIAQDRILTIPICTFESHHFPSYRREGKGTGRIFNYICRAS